MNRVMLLAGSLLLSPAGWANDLSGFWKADQQPAWIEVRASDDATGETGRVTGIVRRNDVNPAAAGRTLLKDIAADGDSPGSWRGQIYAARLGEYRDAEITLLAPSRMQITVKVGFMSRSFVWERVAEIPATE